MSDVNTQRLIRECQETLAEAKALLARALKRESTRHEQV
jgi:exonuclease VII small subunit